MLSAFERPLVCLLLCCAASVVAQPAARPATHSALEFPLELRHKIVAGETPVGAAVQGRLVIATLVHGVVIPEGALFAGKVEESAARDGGKPSRLRVHITSSKWRGGSEPVDLYLTNVFYPRHRGRQGDPNEPSSEGARRRASIAEILQNGGVVPLPDAEPLSIGHRYERRATIENVKLDRGEQGMISITAEKFNLRLDSGTVYCFEASAGK